MPDDLDSADAEDARLLEQGDYARVLARYLPLIQRVVGRRLTGADTEDVTSQVVLHLWSELTAGKRYSAPFRVVALKRAKWTVLDFLRRRNPVPVDPSELDEIAEPAEPSDWGYVRTLLDALPPRDREVFELAVYGGLGPPEIADRIGVERNAVDQALHRARTKLRTLIDG